MYLKNLNNDMVGFSNTTARDMIEHIFLSYGSITAVDLERNWENMRRAWDPQQPVETLLKQIQDFIDYAEAGRGGSLPVRRRSYKLIIPRFFPLGPPTVLAAVGTKEIIQNRTRITSRSIFNFLPPAQSNAGINSGCLWVCQCSCGTI
jgi:hypothetical protein